MGEIQRESWIMTAKAKIQRDFSWESSNEIIPIVELEWTNARRKIRTRKRKQACNVGGRNRRC